MFSDAGGLRRRWAMLLPACVAGTVAMGISTADASTFPTAGDISIDLQAAPDVIDMLTARLELDGTDMSPNCSPSDDPDQATTTVCTDLPDGTYDVVIDGVTSDMFVDIHCSDITAAPATRPVVDIDNAFWSWTCVAQVGAPAVIAGTNVYSDDAPADIGLQLVADDGDAVGCIGDEYNGAVVERCRFALDTTVEAEVIGLPDGYISFVYCLPTVGTPIVGTATAIAQVTTDNWLWVCSLDTVDASVVVEMIAGVFDDDSWSDGIDIAVTGPDGTDVTSTCTPTVPPRNAGWLCPFTEPGDYTVAFSGLPDLPVGEMCDGFTLTADPTESVICLVEFGESTAPSTTSPPTSSPPTTIEPADALPDTGGELTSSVVAAVLIGVGAALVLASRRRPGHHA